MTINVEHGTLNAWPSVTALCPTFGRFERLRDAVACFLLQDYPGDRRLLILNDAPSPLSVRTEFPSSWGITGWNEPTVEIIAWNLRARCGSLGQKRQTLLLNSLTPIVAHWDDDDLYLPWHLTFNVAALLAAPDARCANTGAAWYAMGPRDSWTLHGIHHNTFEGQMVFDRDRALELGGYPPLDSGQAAALLNAFRKAGELVRPDVSERGPSYVYRWSDGLGHVSARRAPNRFLEGNSDFGNGQPLIPEPDALAWARDRVAPQFAKIKQPQVAASVR